MVEDVRDEEIGIEEGGFVWVDSGYVCVGSVGGRTEIVDVAVDHSVSAYFHRSLNNG